MTFATWIFLHTSQGNLMLLLWSELLVRSYGTRVVQHCDIRFAMDVVNLTSQQHHVCEVHIDKSISQAT